VPYTKTRDNGKTSRYVARCLCPAGAKLSRQIPSVEAIWPPSVLDELFPGRHDGPSTDAVAAIPADTLDKAGIPPAMQSWTFETVPLRSQTCSQARARDILRAWLTVLDCDLVLAGPPGVGKTGLAIATIRAALAIGYSVQFWLTADWMLSLQATFAESATETEADRLQAAKHPTILVLDDVSARRSTPYYSDTLQHLLDLRHAAGRRTILTTHFALDDLARMWPDSLVDRLRGRARWISLKGPSLRRVGG
jgi:DNA replication protein DnaC